LAALKKVKVPKFEPRTGVSIETDEKKAAEAAQAVNAARELGKLNCLISSCISFPQRKTKF